jgi:hypothetical protein
MWAVTLPLSTRMEVEDTFCSTAPAECPLINNAIARIWVTAKVRHVSASSVCPAMLES